jgi:hypothetical protein
MQSIAFKKSSSTMLSRHIHLHSAPDADEFRMFIDAPSDGHLFKLQIPKCRSPNWRRNLNAWSRAIGFGSNNGSAVYFEDAGNPAGPHWQLHYTLTP